MNQTQAFDKQQKISLCTTCTIYQPSCERAVAVYSTQNTPPLENKSQRRHKNTADWWRRKNFLDLEIRNDRRTHFVYTHTHTQTHTYTRNEIHTSLTRLNFDRRKNNTDRHSSPMHSCVKVVFCCKVMRAQ